MGLSQRVSENQRFIPAHVLFRSVRNSNPSDVRLSKKHAVCFSFYKYIFRGQQKGRGV